MYDVEQSSIWGAKLHFGCKLTRLAGQHFRAPQIRAVGMIAMCLALIDDPGASKVDIAPDAARQILPGLSVSLVQVHGLGDTLQGGGDLASRP
jgi:hypothetical protein